MIAAIDILLKHSHTVAEERTSKQASIFGAMEGGAARPKLPQAKAWDELTRLP